MYNIYFSKFVEDNLFSLKIKQFLFNPIRSTLVHSIQFDSLNQFWSPSIHFKLIGS